jgi:hypothetical protein
VRAEYEIFHRLVWDAAFRKAFISEGAPAIRRCYEDGWDETLFNHPVVVPGLQEEAYRRVAAVCRTSKQVFPGGHELLMGHFGDAFFEQVLTDTYLSLTQSGQGVLEILEPFDGYIVGPAIMRRACTAATTGPRYVTGVLDREWALWHARRVLNGWPALYDASPLVQGTSLVEADFDLRNLMKEVRRLETSHVGRATYAWRVVPPPGSYAALIFPRDGEVVEARLGDAERDTLKRAILSRVSDDRLTLTARRLGMVLSASFLCCPRAEESGGEVARRLFSVVQPQGH